MKKNIQSERDFKIKFRHLREYVLFSSICMLGLGTIGSCFHGNGGNDGSIKRVYILAFAEKDSDRIRVRWSENGVAWTSSPDFPNETTDVGIGATSDDHGIFNIIYRELIFHSIYLQVDRINI